MWNEAAGAARTESVASPLGTALRASALVCAVLAAACGGGLEEAPPERLLYTLRGDTMGTYYVVKVVRPADQPLEDAVQEGLRDRVEAELDLVNGAMSTYIDGSELSRFNRWTELEPFEVSAATLEVARAAVALGRLTEGALDVTVAPLMAAYGFGEDGVTSMPDDATLDHLRQRIGFHRLVLGEDPPSLGKTVPDLEVDLSSIAKGYAIDRVVDALVNDGFEDLFVEVGGEVRAKGHNLRDRPWRVGIERPGGGPTGGGGIQRLMELDDVAVATSGDYRIYREVNGERVSHILDPRSGLPIRHRLASVSVVRPTCMEADGLATALMVLGPDEGLELATREGVAALFLVRSGKVFDEISTPAFEAAFEGEATGP
ncbi:MAG: FAD:protein FMN transferase [Acidobacteriota bacterium]